jgi:hypothetical protein
MSTTIDDIVFIRLQRDEQSLMTEGELQRMNELQKGMEGRRCQILNGLSAIVHAMPLDEKELDLGDLLELRDLLDFLTEDLRETHETEEIATQAIRMHLERLAARANEASSATATAASARTSVRRPRRSKPRAA